MEKCHVLAEIKNLFFLKAVEILYLLQHSLQVIFEAYAVPVDTRGMKNKIFVLQLQYLVN